VQRHRRALREHGHDPDAYARSELLAPDVRIVAPLATSVVAIPYPGLAGHGRGLAAADEPIKRSGSGDGVPT
jgi:hypothetical protein